MESVGFDPRTSPPHNTFAKSDQPTYHTMPLDIYMSFKIFMFTLLYIGAGVGPGPSPDPWFHYITYNRGIIYMARGFNTKPWFGYIIYNHCLYIYGSCIATGPARGHISIAYDPYAIRKFARGNFERLARF
jgi:hypothetical protein